MESRICPGIRNRRESVQDWGEGGFHQAQMAMVIILCNRSLNDSRTTFTTVGSAVRRQFCGHSGRVACGWCLAYVAQEGGTAPYWGRVDSLCLSAPDFLRHAGKPAQDGPDRGRPGGGLPSTAWNMGWARQVLPDGGGGQESRCADGPGGNTDEQVKWGSQSSELWLPHFGESRSLSWRFIGQGI